MYDTIVLCIETFTKGDCMDGERMMTTGEVANYLQLDIQTVSRMAQRGELPAVKVGREWRFKKEYLDAKFDDELKRKLCAQ